MQYDPKLKKAMEEIKNILKKYDIAACVILKSDTRFSEHLIRIDPSWSCAFWDETGALRVKAKAEDFAGDVKKRDQVLNDTFNMVTHFTDISGVHFEMMHHLFQILEKKLNGEKGDGDYTSHATQNN